MYQLLIFSSAFSSTCSLPFSIIFLPFFCTTPPLLCPFILYGFYPPGQITYFILYLLCNFSLPCMISVLKLTILFTVIYTVPPFASSSLWDNFFNIPLSLSFSLLCLLEVFLCISFNCGFPYFNQFSIVRTLFIFARLQRRSVPFLLLKFCSISDFVFCYSFITLLILHLILLTSVPIFLYL